jgi:hypothetical protein
LEAVHGHHLVADVLDGVKFADGIAVTRVGVRGWMTVV